MDICMCKGDGCARKDSCLRHTAQESYMQTYFVEVPIDKHGKCVYYWEHKKEDK